MKILGALLLFCAMTMTFAQTNSCSANNTTCTTGSNSDSAHIITTAGDVALSNEEVATLKLAIENAQHASAAAQAAQAALQAVQKAIAANHGAPAAGPYQINTDFSTAISQVPPVVPAPVQVWVKVASEGDVVLIKAGTTVRYGAPAGTVNQADGTKLAADVWNPPVTYAKDTTLSVTNVSFGPDPALNCIKELDQLGTAGGVARTTAQ